MQGSETSNGATFFVILNNWSERKGKNQSVFSMVNDFNRRAAAIQEAEIFAVNPPAISGLGVAGGLEMELQDRNNLGVDELQKAVADLSENVRSEPDILALNSMFQGNTPQYFINVDRDRVEMQQLQLSDVFTTLSYYLGSAYVNDFVQFGRIYQVQLEAAANARKVVSDVLKLSVRNANNQMVPFSSFVTLEEQLGMNLISRYNMYTSAAITAIPNPSKSSGQAIQSMEELTTRVLGNNFSYEWTSVAYQETQASSSVSLIFILAIIIAILVLSAQYESWTSPIAVILGLPLALLGAILGCWIMGLPISIYSQIGIILLIALSAKNAILIVEFARDYRQQGESITSASIEAGRVRLRPILMTSFAFIFGVMPLLFASGAGAQSRISLGTAVVFGMALNAIFGTLLIPNFYHLMQTVQEKWLTPVKKQPKGPKPVSGQIYVEMTGVQPSPIVTDPAPAEEREVVIRRISGKGETRVPGDKNIPPERIFVPMVKDQPAPIVTEPVKSKAAGKEGKTGRNTVRNKRRT